LSRGSIPRAVSEWLIIGASILVASAALLWGWPHAGGTRVIATLMMAVVSWAIVIRLVRSERAAARAADQKFQVLLHDIDAVVWDSDPYTFQFRFVSERARDILGYPVTQWTQEADFWANHLHPEDRDAALEACRKAVEAGGDHRLEYRMIAADGRVVWIRDNLRVGQNPDGLRRMRGVMVDITEAKRAQRALERSESTYRALVEALPDLLFRIRKDGVLLDCRSPHYLRLEVDPAFLIGHTIEELLPAELAADSWNLMRKAFETRAAQMYEFRLPLVNGPGDFEARLAALGDEEVLVLVRDITSRKQAEESLRAAEAELRRVLSSVSDGVWSAEIGSAGDGKFVYHSVAVERLRGRPREHYTGIARWFEQIHPEDRPRIQDVFARMREMIYAHERFEYRVFWPDGTLRWLRTTVSASHLEDEHSRFDGVDSDITAHKAAEEALRRANEALRAVIEASPLAIFEVDLTGGVKSWNPAAERILGWSREEVLGSPLPWLADGDFEVLRQRVAAGATQNAVDVIERRKDGAAVELSLWSAPLTDASGAPSGFITLAADITERRELEAQLRQSQKMEAVGRLAGGVAHDFNNLLTVITGYAYMLVQDVGESEALRANAEEILRAVDRASALTSQLLAFSRRQIAKPRPVDLTALVANMDRMLRRVIGEDIDLVADLAPGLAKVKADPGQIEQVVMNLVVNARDAMPGGGCIIIRTAAVQLDPDFARFHPCARPGAYVVLAVTDTGHGMGDDVKAHLFEPFFTTKEPGKGTGLGLSMVYGIVRQCGGEITVASEPGHGATITIYLPQIEAAEEDSADSPAPTTLEAGRETILLVEDEDEVRRLLRGALAQQGYTVIEASGPEEAIRLSGAFREHIDLMLSDVVMPHMSGLDLARTLAPERPDMRVLFMSGYTEDPAFQDGSATPFIRKPFTPRDLAEKLRDALHQAPRLV
jgi:two-component system cell cycle sensor histidine kinase/response regulator CckA